MSSDFSPETLKPVKTHPKTTKPSFQIDENSEEFVIVSTATGQIHAMVPFKPFGTPNRELYRDRLSRAEAQKSANLILAALNLTIRTKPAMLQPGEPLLKPAVGVVGMRKATRTRKIQS